MKLTHSQISEILSNNTSSSEGFVTLQSLIMNSLMFHEREVFVSANGNLIWQNEMYRFGKTKCDYFV